MGCLDTANGRVSRPDRSRPRPAIPRRGREPWSATGSCTLRQVGPAGRRPTRREGGDPGARAAHAPPSGNACRPSTSTHSGRTLRFTTRVLTPLPHASPSPCRRTRGALRSRPPLRTRRGHVTTSRFRLTNTPLLIVNLSVKRRAPLAPPCAQLTRRSVRTSVQLVGKASPVAALPPPRPPPRLRPRFR